MHEGLTHLLPLYGFAVVSLAKHGRDAVKIAKKAQADIVMTDIHLPGSDGLELLEAIHQSSLSVLTLVYSSHGNPTYIARAIAHGAADFVFKTAPVECLIAALQELAEPDSASKNQLFVEIRHKLTCREIDHPNPRDLTHREMQVLRHLGFGLSNREIAKSLGISVETVKEHVQNILRKLGCKDRTEAAVRAVREGLS